MFTQGASLMHKPCSKRTS